MNSLSRSNVNVIIGLLYFWLVSCFHILSVQKGSKSAIKSITKPSVLGVQIKAKYIPVQVHKYNVLTEYTIFEHTLVKAGMYFLIFFYF